MTTITLRDRIQAALEACEDNSPGRAEQILRAALTATTNEAAGQWRPIETAPTERSAKFIGLTKSGRAITAVPSYGVYDAGPVFRGWDEEERGSFVSADLVCWMPFPGDLAASPATAGERKPVGQYLVPEYYTPWERTTHSIAGKTESAALSTQPVQAQEEAVAWLVEWQGPNGQTWVHAHASELPAVEQARKNAGRCTPLYTHPAPAVDRGLSEASILDEVEQRLHHWRCPIGNEDGDHLGLYDLIGNDHMESLVDEVCAPIALAASAPSQADPSYPAVDPMTGEANGPQCCGGKPGCDVLEYCAGKATSQAEPAQAWNVVTWSTKTDRTFATRQEAIDYITMNDHEGDWHVEPASAAPSQAGSCQASADEQHSSDQRGRALRFIPSDDGRAIDDDDFIYDAMLRVDGDFSDDSVRHSYAQWLCDKLNSAAPPAGRTLTDVVNSMPITWELSWGSDDEEAPCNWRVHECSGSRNDREWKLIGEGPAPADAILAASSTTAGERE